MFIYAFLIIFLLYCFISSCKQINKQTKQKKGTLKTQNVQIFILFPDIKKKYMKT